MPTAMTFSGGIEPASIQSITIQATVKPDNADNKTVDWEVTWINPSSTWASGKTVSTYLTVTPTIDGSTTATVSCLQAFGEKVKITVISRQNENAKAECIVDYASRIENTKIEVYADTDFSSLCYTIPVSGNDYTFSGLPPIQTGPKLYIYEYAVFQIIPTYSTHTLADTFSCKYYLQFNQTYLNALTAQGFTLKANAADRKEITKMDNPFWFGASALNLTSGALNSILECKGADYNKLIAAAKTIGTNNFGTLEVVATGAYSSFSRTINIKITPATFVVSATSIELNNSTLVV